MPLVVFSSPLSRGGAGLKFFFIQRVAGLVVFIFFIEAIYFSWSSSLLALVRGLIIYKIGGFPFHQWMVLLRSSLSWESLGVVLTFQKIIPLYFLSALACKPLALVIGLGWPVLAMLGLLIKQAKKLFVVSSIFFLGALVLRVSLGGWKWKGLLLIYLVIFLTLSYFIGGESVAPGSLLRFSSKEEKLNWLFVLLVLRGVPPFPGFFLKLEVLSFFLHTEIWLIVVFVVARALFLFIYLGLMLWVTLKGYLGAPSLPKKSYGASLCATVPVLRGGC